MLLEFILNDIPIGILYCDTDCRVRFINKTYAEYLGASRKEIIGRPVTDFIPDSRLNIVMQTGRMELGDKCDIDYKGGRKTLVVS